MTATIHQAIQKIEEELSSAAEQLAGHVPMTQVANEWEVVFLLGALSAHCNIALSKGSGAFPDALLAIDVNGSRVYVRTELEWRASDFDRHGHDANGCDLIISYYQDRTSVSGVPVIGLQQRLPNLSIADVVEIQHEDKPHLLQQIFQQLDDAVRRHGFTPQTMAEKRGFTNSHTYNAAMPGGKNKVLCRVQYLNTDHVQFTWRQGALADLGVNEPIGKFIPRFQLLLEGRKSHAFSTETEYKLNVYPGDIDLLNELCHLVEETISIATSKVT